MNDKKNADDVILRGVAELRKHNIVVNFKVMKIKFINIKSLNILWYEMYQGQ